MWIDRMISGRGLVRISVQFSLPRKSRSTSSVSACTRLPIAPSQRRTRSRKASRKLDIVCSVNWACGKSGDRGPRRDFLARPDAEDVADRVGQIGAVQRIEMELFDSVVLQAAALLGRDRRSDQPARIGI